MSQFNIIENKLKHFLKRFYINELLKGLLLFYVFSAFLTVVVSIEFFYGLTQMLELFSLVSCSVCCFVHQVLLNPLLVLFKFKSGMSYNEASTYIGSNFPEVSDVLLNLVQLKNETATTDLILSQYRE